MKILRVESEKTDNLLRQDKMDQRQQERLKMIPGVDKILEMVKSDPFFQDIPKPVSLNAIRGVIDGLRKTITDNAEHVDDAFLAPVLILKKVKQNTARLMTANLRRVVNATGIVIHTNLGRSLLSREAVENMATVAENYTNLEFDLEKGRRGLRYSAVEGLLCEISGAESAMVVNNNAGAVLLCLETLARGKKAVVSRGELVEIGGSFRIPDVMSKSGAILKEVGTTNRTHFHDYERAIESDTGLLLKVHQSNFSIVGFHKAVSLEDLVKLGTQYHIPVMEDLGSGTFVDFSQYGLVKEPTVQESVKAGADIVTFSGDKLLGGPQAGIIVGKKEFIDEIKKNPITRALRIDKLTLAALETTLRHYRDPEKAIQEIPTLRLLTLSLGRIEEKALALQKRLRAIDDPRLDVQLMDLASKAGGGSLPLLEIPSKCLGISISGMTVNFIEKQLRFQNPPIIGRIENDRFILDLRTVREEDFSFVENAFMNLINPTA
jgi:L-seryl-tRNA(Ser) seleniumtransferase